ncbi:uncharacterized protein MYCFIDRAFT_191726 [Pseudocercospora fijiensis CIRAD86]|uniref:Uncharacterized protein n=1 Tax=Pseudocercospora fijiensis (strain CIRAD86) TaxID=383855 RepID=N1Q6Y2_PSEFD|nr:uncharacterized protein MYCFIDRAFT_191726 [Pseudocercospora fijiensis CIRAD86]EME87221.1 hypothetical protein MYCFIDRAFT_191726 [Pseudocercospora fijiensis CIRAD86]
MSSSSRDFNNMHTAASPSSAISVDDYLQRCFQAIDDLANNPYVNGTLPGPDEERGGQEHRGSIQESPMRGSSHRNQNQVARKESQYLDTSRSQTPKAPTGSRSTTPIPGPPKYNPESSSKAMKSPVDHMHLPPVTPKPESKMKGFKAFMRPSWR